MLQHIVLALDGSQEAEALMPLVRDLALARNVNVHLVHAVESTQDSSRNYLSDVQARFDAAGLRATFQEVTGDPQETLADLAAEQDTLVALSAPRRSGIAGLFSQDLAASLLGAGVSPLLVYHPSGTQQCQPVQRVLLPLDGSQLSERAITWAAYLATSLQVPAEVLQVAGDDDREPAAVAVQAGAQGSARYVEEVTDRLRNAGVDATYVVRRGDAARHIQRSAAEQPGTLVVMASYPGAGVERAYLGSVADTLTHEHDLPLFLIRPDAP